MALFISIAFVSCKNPTDNDPESQMNLDYFPLEVGNKWIYAEIFDIYAESSDTSD